MAMMKCCNPVQQKIPCLFKTEVVIAQSSKRSGQSFKVQATEELHPEVKDNMVEMASATEKVDGTCVMIAEFQNKPWLWARYDRKPNKMGAKRFAEFQKLQKKKTDRTEFMDLFEWADTDLKNAPENWIPAKGVMIKNNIPQANAHGHIPGWVPVLPKFRQYCWHLDAVHLDTGLALVLREEAGSGSKLELVPCKLKELLNQTAELIGTYINGNPYNIGNKQHPLHMLVIHGSLKIKYTMGLQLSELRLWFESETLGKVEGIVWHCKDGSLFKIHRHHLGLPWKFQEPLLERRIQMDVMSGTTVESMKQQLLCT